MTKVTIVYNDRNKKLIPFAFEKDGSIIITSSGMGVKPEHMRVLSVDSREVDWENGYWNGKEECS